MAYYTVAHLLHGEAVFHSVRQCHDHHHVHIASLDTFRGLFRVFWSVDPGESGWQEGQPRKDQGETTSCGDCRDCFSTLFSPAVLACWGRGFDRWGVGLCVLERVGLWGFLWTATIDSYPSAFAICSQIEALAKEEQDSTEASGDLLWASLAEVLPF